MSIESNKSKIFDKIKLYVGIAYSELNNTTFDSVLSKSNNPYDFLFDLVKTTIGENGLETLTQVALSTIITQQYLNNLSDKVYDSIGKTIPENLSSNTTTFDLSLKSIDPANSFKKPELSQQSNQQTNKFFKDIKNNVLKQAGTTKTFSLGNNVGDIKMKYVEVSGTVETTLPSTTTHQLFDGLRLLAGPIFSANIVINEIINILFHTDFTKEDAEILTIIRSYTRYETKDVFKMDLKKLLDLELDTNVKGYNIDSSCFRENVEITTQQLDSLIATPTIQNFKSLIPEYNDEIGSNGSNDYCKNIINTIIEAILSIIVKQPVVLFIMSIINKVLDFGADLGSLDIPALFEKYKTLIENIFDNIYEDIFCVIFNWIKKYLLKLVVLVTIQLLKEQLEKRKDILASLSGARFVNKAKEFKI
jgi:hypothetical protein